MNDCLWRSIGVCEKDCKCKSYMSMNCEDGSILGGQWEKIVSSGLKQHAIRFAEANGFESEGNDGN